MNAAMMACRHHYAHGLLVMHLGAIGAGVEPAFLGIARDAVGPRSDIAAGVFFVPFGRGENGHIDVVPHHDVLQDRAVLHHNMRDHSLFLEVGFPIGVAELPFGEMIGEAERHVAASAGEHVHEQTKSLGAARDILEHHAGTMLRAQDCFGSEPDILFAFCPLDGAALAQPLGSRKPFAQVVVADVAGKVALMDHPSGFLPWSARTLDDSAAMSLPAEILRLGLRYFKRSANDEFAAGMSQWVGAKRQTTPTCGRSPGFRRCKTQPPIRAAEAKP